MGARAIAPALSIGGNLQVVPPDDFGMMTGWASRSDLPYLHTVPFRGLNVALKLGLGRWIESETPSKVFSGFAVLTEHKPDQAAICVGVDKAGIEFNRPAKVTDRPLDFFS